MSDKKPYKHDGIEGLAYFGERQAPHWEALGWTAASEGDVAEIKAKPDPTPAPELVPSEQPPIVTTPTEPTPAPAPTSTESASTEATVPETPAAPSAADDGVAVTPEAGTAPASA